MNSNTSAHLMGRVQGTEHGPTVVIIGGIHGNEPAGVMALEEICREIRETGMEIRGTLYALKGNPEALRQGKRFIDEDLNRIWRKERIKALSGSKTLNNEELAMQELLGILDTIFRESSPPYYFIDLHSTSGDTHPFITINDALINRNFARLYQLPIILGIEEYLSGPLLNYLNLEGWLSMGLEVGQHHAAVSLKNAISLIWMTFVFTGLLNRSQYPAFTGHRSRIAASAGGLQGFYEIIYRERIRAGDQFEMVPGFRNFDPVAAKTLLADLNGQEIISHREGILFMPLYQAQGEDGFFLVRDVPAWILWLSVLTRKIRSKEILALLPGISITGQDHTDLWVTAKTFKRLGKPIFHLLGYRCTLMENGDYRMTNREFRAKSSAYRDAPWKNGLLK